MGQVDFAHASGPEWAYYLVGTESCAGRKRHAEVKLWEITMKTRVLVLGAGWVAPGELRRAVVEFFNMHKKSVKPQSRD